MDPEEVSTSLPTEPQPVVQQPTVSPEPSSSNKLLYILGAVVAVMLIGGVAYYFGYDHGFEKSAKNLETSSTVRSQSPSPSPTPDPTANWKTYTNVNYSYTLKYPSDARIAEYGDNSVEIVSPENNLGSSFAVVVEDNFGVQIKNTTTLLEWCDKLKEQIDGPRGNCDRNIGSNKTSRLSGIDAFVLESVGVQDHFEDMYYVPYKDFVYKIHVMTSAPKELTNTETDVFFETPNKILSTFKFTP